MRDIDIEPVLERRVWFRTQMPFPKVTGRIPGLAERLCHGVVFWVEASHSNGNDRFLLAGPFFPGVAFSVTCGKWQLGAVIPVRAGLSPVRIAERVGEHSGLSE